MLDEPLGINQNRLAYLLEQIVAAETNYAPRYGLILSAMTVAHTLGFRSGYRSDPAEPEWPVAFIELPTGQVSWHMPQFPLPWDGHTTEEKHARIAEYRRSVPEIGEILCGIEPEVLVVVDPSARILFDAETPNA